MRDRQDPHGDVASDFTAFRVIGWSRRSALITNDPDASTARSADRWSIKVARQDARPTVGAGEARDRIR